MPIWVGGQGGRSLRRAVELGDGWAPFGLKPPAARALLDSVGAPDLDVILQPARPLDAVREPQRASETLDELRQAGATYATLRFVHHSPADYVDQLEATMALAR